MYQVVRLSSSPADLIRKAKLILRADTEPFMRLLTNEWSLFNPFRLW